MGMFDFVKKAVGVAAPALGSMFGPVGVIGGGIISNELLGSPAADAAGRSAGIQSGAATAGIEEQRRQFDEMQKLLKPYVEAGDSALAGQLALLGLGGDEAYQKAISDIEMSPEFEAMTRTGEEAIVQSASATGGLRGGNIQRALSQFRPEVLSNLINKKFGQLGGITSTGQASAAGVGAAGQTMGTNIANLLETRGEAEAGGVMAKGRSEQAFQDDLIKQAGQFGTEFLKGIF